MLTVSPLHYKVLHFVNVLFIWMKFVLIPWISTTNVVTILCRYEAMGLTKFQRVYLLLWYHEESVCRVWQRCRSLGARKSAECEGLIYDSLPNVQCPNRPQRESLHNLFARDIFILIWNIYTVRSLRVYVFIISLSFVNKIRVWYVVVTKPLLSYK